MNAAELGLANLKMAMQDQSLMSEVAKGMRQPEGLGELVRIMADPKFLKLEFYGAHYAAGAMKKPDAQSSSSAPAQRA